MESGTRIRIGHAVVDVVSRNEVLQRARRLLSTESALPAVITTVNAQFVHLAHQRPRFEALLKHSDINVADGMSLVVASRLLGRPLPERITGVELSVDLCALAARLGASVYLLGGHVGAARGTAAHLEMRFPGLRIAGVDCPPTGFEKSPELAAAVRQNPGRPPRRPPRLSRRSKTGVLDRGESLRSPRQTRHRRRFHIRRSLRRGAPRAPLDAELRHGVVLSALLGPRTTLAPLSRRQQLFHLDRSHSGRQPILPPRTKTER